MEERTVIYQRRPSARTQNLNGSACHRWLLCAAGLLFASQIGRGQSILGTNLIVNGNAEAGPASPDGKTVVSSIPNWTRTKGNANVLPYGLTGFVQLTDPAPPDHGFNYFVGAPNGAPSTVTQTIDVSSEASAIAAGNLKYTASAYLGSTEGSGFLAQVVMDFQNAAGENFSTVTLGPVKAQTRAGMSLQQQIGLVPIGTTQITVTMTFPYAASAVDSVSLVFTTLGTAASSVLGTNLVVNGGAEAGPSAPAPNFALYVPGWSTGNGASVAPYGGSNWITADDPTPPNEGVNLFWGGTGYLGYIYQDIDVSPAASLIDTSQITYVVSAWLGGLSGYPSPTLTYTFFDWSGNQLAATAQLGPFSYSGTGLYEISDSDVLPSGTRRVHIVITFPYADTMADDIAFSLAAPSGPPVIDGGGIVSASAFGGFPVVAPGTWIEIYGINLTNSPATGWSGSNFVNGVAPTALSDVTVSVGGQAAYIDYISPGQVNALVPSDVPYGTGEVNITLTNSKGTSDPFPIYVYQTLPGLLAPASFMLNNKQYVAAILQDGNYALPDGAISGVGTRPARPGETVTIYGVGFGPVSPDFPAGTVVTAQNSLTNPIAFLFGNTQAETTYDGLAPSLVGLYQFNVVVPNVPANNATPLSFNLGSMGDYQTLYIAVGN
jgi:uncharacterized protein (TIGR03437 family)